MAIDRPAERTRTSSFGVGRREGHDASDFYARFTPPTLSDDDHVARNRELLDELGQGRLFEGSIDRMANLPDNSVALVVTSPPYFVGKEYELAVTGDPGAGDTGSGHPLPKTYLDYLDMLRRVLIECVRVLEPGGRMAINVANLGRKPYRSLSADVISILQDDLGLLLRGEIIWMKSEASAGSCAWGSFARASNPVLRDTTERVIVASKGRFARAGTARKRQTDGLPHHSSLANDEFVDVTRDVWRIDAESARAVGHPAPFPIELPRRLIDLYTYEDDIVVDPFVGSGTTVAAAARAGRIGVGYDIDPDYIDLARRRLAAELERSRALAATVADLNDASAVEQAEVVAGLDPVDRQEYFHSRAVAEGKKIHDIARRVLEDAGFASVNNRARHRPAAIDFDFTATGPEGAHPFLVDVAGAFTTNRPGLQRTDAVWKLLGRLHVVRASERRALTGTGSESSGPNAASRVLVLTSHLPRAGSPGDEAIRAVGPEEIFDVIELYDPAGLDRLARYAATADPSPLPGFWTTDDLESWGGR